MHQHRLGVCQTPGCFTFVLRTGDRWCLACQLDRQLPQPPWPPSRADRQRAKHNGRA